jgi:hypothetical protein
MAAADASVPTSLVADIQSALPASALVSTLRVAHESASRELYAYAELRETVDADKPLVVAIERALAVRCPDSSDRRVCRLQKVFDVAGASRSATPDFHYVVETDVEDGWRGELNDWYDNEHMPGLAAVPGCVHASRYLNHDGPASHACYLLTSAETKGSPPWMAMTNSPWSSRVRPHFTNTKRTMFNIVKTSLENGA